MKKYLSIIISGALCFCVFVFFFVVGGVHEKQLNTQNDQIVALQNKLSEYQLEQELVHDQALVKATGYSISRVNNDDAHMQEFFKKVFSWTTDEEYDNIRAEILSKYNLTDDSTFVQNFIPAKPEWQIDDKKGKDQYNMSFESMNSYVTDISGTDYRYFTVVKCSTHAANGGESFTTLVAEYTTDVNGNLSDFEGHLVSIE